MTNARCIKAAQVQPRSEHLRDPRQAMLAQGCLFGTLWEATRSSVAVTAAIRPSEDESCGCR